MQTLFQYYREHPGHSYLNEFQEEEYIAEVAIYDGDILSNNMGIMRVRDHEDGSEYTVVDYDVLKARVQWEQH